MKTLQLIKRIIKQYFIVTGVLAHVVLIVGLYVLMQHFALTPRQFLIKALEKSGINSPMLVAAVAPPAQFSDHKLDGHLRKSHPRIILPELKNWTGQGAPELFQRRIAQYQKLGIQDFDPCKSGNSVLATTACWINRGDNATAARLISMLKSFEIETPDVEAKYGNGWELAFAYDFLSRYPGLTVNDRTLIESRIEYALRDYLRVLDDPSPSLWHGRTTLASKAWLCAVVLDPSGSKERPGLIARAQGHFLNVVSAAELTEGWPEGYNYWIQNRAFIFTLAANAYLNGLADAKNHQRILKVLRRIGLWTIYATRPDNRIEGFGDEGSRVDLKDETRRVIDLIAQATRDSVFATYSRYLEKLHGKESYYSGYQWGFRLFNDPEVVGLTGGKGLEAFNGLLPDSDIFGKGALNEVYIHSDWSPLSTFISFRAGDSFVQHGHYDAGHFTIFKGAPLAINSSTYNGKNFFSPNRLNYSIRTVATNSLLILRPGEKVQPNKFFKKNVSDGGQRIVIPTGSEITSVQDWAMNRMQGKFYAGGSIEHYDNVEGDYVYIASDLTDAYNTPTHDEGGYGGKVKSVKRNLVYLFDEDRLLVNDYVLSTDKSYTKKWLLHSINEPKVIHRRVLKGQADDGISESPDHLIRIQNGHSHLRVDAIYPTDAVVRIVGGPDYQYYVESDGDDSDLDGENFVAGSSTQPWFDVGMWRIEIQPGAPRKADEFLVALSPSIGSQRQDGVKRLKVVGSPGKGIATLKTLVIFMWYLPHGEFKINVPGKQKRLLVFGLPPSLAINATLGTEHRKRTANLQGVSELSIHSGIKSIAIKW